MKCQKPDWDTLIREIEEANKDPKFVKAVKEFINITSNRRVYKV
ncbi:MAG TPA: hypothetical protein VJB08_03160 [Candidatus Nanoarchaeia archaeon]|nr:hypothetical protein [Candidatus Nanoarchaeia archaeon]